MELVPFAIIPFMLAAVLAVGGLLASWLWQQQEQQAFRALVPRHPELEPTTSPLGLDQDELAARFAALPEGHRRRGLAYGVQGPLRAWVAGHEHVLEAAAFLWWWQWRQQNPQHSHRHRRLRRPVAVVRLPAAVPSPIRVRPEPLLGRSGVRRRGHQLASEPFDRRFRVECADDRLVELFLDATMQTTLTDVFAGRDLELVDDLLVLVGPSGHPFEALRRPIDQLPAVRRDAARLVAAVPEQLWRHLGVPSGVADGRNGRDPGGG